MSSRNRSTVERLRRLSSELRSLPKVRHKISVRVAKQFMRIIREDFARQIDPYGKRQKPKKYADGRKILHGPTGRLRRFSVRFKGVNGFTIIPGADYYRYNQPTRHMLPVAGKMPPKWERILFAVSRDEITKHLKSVR